jgi:hypothetical protein
MLFSFFGFTLLAVRDNNGDVYDTVLRMAELDEGVHAL